MKKLQKFCKLLKILIIFSCFLTFENAVSAQLPRFLGSEKKFRSYIFNPNEVYRYLGHYTYQGFVEFEKDETIQTISMGDPSLWLFEHLGNRLFLKPVGEDNSQTNMTIITNKRIYHFELMAKEAKDINDKDLIFVAKFVYPDEKDRNILEFPKAIASDEPDLRDLSIYNFNYQYTGEAGITPIKVFDNGEFTYFEFSKKNAEVPAIFSVDASGFESLVNFRASGSYIIVEKVTSQFTLRSGSDIVCVYNVGMIGTRTTPSFPGSAKAPQANFTPPPSDGFFGAPKKDQRMTYPAGVNPVEPPLGINLGGVPSSPISSGPTVNFPEPPYPGSPPRF